MVNMAHDFLAATECANWHTSTDRLRQADEVWLNWIEFGDATWSNCHASFDLIEDQQHPMRACNITHVLKIAFIREYDANIHQYRFGDYCRHLALVLGQDAIQSLPIVVGSDNNVVLQGGWNAR